REAVPGGTVTVHVDQPRQEQPVGSRWRELPVPPCAVPLGGRADVRDPVADDGDHTVVDDRATGDQPAPQHGALFVGQDCVPPVGDASTVLAGAVVVVAVVVVAGAGWAASSVLASTASVSSSRPGVCRFHFRITKRNST
ncbi:MAG: hypothetical protein JWP68_1017, partial [Modestobacter sp.]|nr:hypothetical protein [Modestobacter sp.]